MNTIMNNQSEGIIIPNMKMPDSCMACPFYIWGSATHEASCMFTHEVIPADTGKFHRISSCILIPTHIEESL